MGAVDRIEFEYWSDPLCIWAFVAQPKLEHVLSRHGTHVAPRYHVVPVFGSIRERFATGTWSKAGPQGRAETTRSIAEQHARTDVSGRCWIDDCPVSSWPVGAALKAVFAAEAAGEVGPGVAADYQWRMRERFFVDDQNVAKRTVQLELAEELQIPVSTLARRLDDGSALCALWEDHERRESMGLRGSPTFVFDGGRAMLYGNFSEAILTATVEELVKGLDVGGSDC